MKYLKFLVGAIIFSGCCGNNIDCLNHEKLKFKNLPAEIINCVENPNEFKEERNSMLITLPKGVKPEYKVESVKTWIGPWVAHVRLTNIKTDVHYKIEPSVPNPFFVFENKLYVPDDYNIFTTSKDKNSFYFTRYDLE